MREESEYREAQLRNLKLHKHSMKLPHSIREPGLVIAPDSPKQDAPTATRTRSEGSLASVGSGVSIAKPDEDASTLDDARPSSGGPDGQELDSMLARVDSALERERTDMTLYASNVVSVRSDAELGCGQLDAADVASTPEQRLRRFVSNSLDSTWKLTVSRWTKIPVYALNGILYVAVIAHAATLASDQYNSSAEWKSVAAVLYIVCSIVYAIEVGFHAAAMHARDPRSVLRSRKLWFKAVLCLLGIVGWAANIEWLKRTQVPSSLPPEIKHDITFACPVPFASGRRSLRAYFFDIKDTPAPCPERIFFFFFLRHGFLTAPLRFVFVLGSRRSGCTRSCG